MGYKHYCKIRGLLVLLLMLAGGKHVHSQVVDTLSLQSVLNIVRAYHPVAIQANLKIDSAQANQMAARGVFDPTVFVENEQKTFTGTNYYYHTEAGIRIPTWYGLDLKAGIENNGGSRLTNDVTKGKSSYAGVSFGVLQGLLFDKRRAAVRQAGILVNQSEAERRNVYNDLLYQAAAAYWEWARSYQVYELISQVVDINQRRLDLVRNAFLGGDRAAIDTVEALTQLQNFLWQQAEASFNLQNATLDLSNFLWLDNVPYNLPTYIIPDTSWKYVILPGYPIPPLEQMLDLARSRHPKLQSLAFKAESILLDRRLKTQNLLPSLKVNYNFLQKGYEAWKGVGQYLFENNYKYGFDLSVPLFLRQARGELKLANIKLRGNELQQNQALLEIENKVRNYYNQAITLQQQIAIFEAARANYQELLRAEEIKFSMGESSLFLLNSRENKLLEAQQKVIELRSKFFKALAALQWASGLLQ